MGRPVCDPDPAFTIAITVMKKVLVTGATGFIGNYVVEELLRKNHSVIASSSNREKAERASWFNKVNYIPFDLAETDFFKDYYSFFGRPDLVIHLAWEGLPNYSSSFHREINLPRHSAFLKNLVLHGCKDLTVTGTCFEYGLQEGALSEEMPAQPVTIYAVAKDELRKNLERLQEQYSFVLKWVRLFYIYGKGQNPNSLLSQLDNAIARGERTFNMSPGDQVRDFLPVEKAAEHIVAIAAQQKVSGIINSCSAVPVTVKEFVNSYLQKIDQKITLNTGYYLYPAYEPMRFWGNDTKLMSLLEQP
jgi:nucleoside-diphosphate-sugar epimerase